MPILTVVSDTSLRSDDADDRVDGEESSAVVLGMGRAASTASEDFLCFEGFEDDPPREADSCPARVSADDVARWFG